MDTREMKILVAVDFTECSDAALETAVMLASRLGASLEIAHVAPPPPAASPAELITRDGYDDTRIREARAQLADVAQRMAERGLKVTTQLAVGSVPFGLLELIEHAKPALVVVGSHGKGPLTRALLGSVSEALCRRSPTPVVVVPSPRRHAIAAKLAWSCAACGYMLGAGESQERCHGCGKSPARWLSAEVGTEPVDANEPPVSDGAEERLSYERTNDPFGLFATSPGGTEGYDVNPELRVRY